MLQLKSLTGELIAEGEHLLNMVEKAKLDLYGADLRGADLRGADLRGANLRGANLRGANLYGADLRGANLRGADLYGANLYGANLRGANLRGANLHGANLHGANLYGADLYGADLRGADLYGANLYGADLRESKYTETATVNRVLCLGPIGSRDAELQVWFTTKGVFCITGCFNNTLEKFKSSVTTTHAGTKYETQYNCVIALIEEMQNGHTRTV